MVATVEPFMSEGAAWLRREAFLSRDIYDQEQERVFRRAWLFLGHESQVPNRRDFFTAYMGEEPVIVTRDGSSTIHAFLNTCRHRGMRVCRAEKGNTAAFTCSYHAWTYDTTGALIGVPKHKEGYYGELKKEEWGLISVKVESYKGLLFGTFDPEATSLRDYLGDMAFYLDVILDRREGGTELVSGVHRWVMKANWKVASDNNSGDWYHVPYTHGSMGRIRRRLGKAPMFQDLENRVQISAHPGHTLVALLADTPEDALRGVTLAVQEYELSILPEVVQRLGPVRSRTIFIAGNVFPNFGWVPGSHSIRVFQPRGPEQMEVWSYCLVDKDAPPEVKRDIRRDYVTSFGPSGMLEQDDGENWTQVSASSHSSLARTLEFNYQMGIGHERFHEDYPGTVGRATGELTHRSFYSRWAQQMGITPGEPLQNGQGGEA